ncbi:hypothetical protein [Clostridium aminobutyricum]|uniref:Uncharacterized protein n=1 Tax=Clostridium aminobutyricum TaxID=33953 RepID=A0A939DB80_CLOAM|nr:hypothetical protein [Clostridium aminobutyricum]MBN7774098.1 hypothetical protein [Clostridium aminobutyricum]
MKEAKIAGVVGVAGIAVVVVSMLVGESAFLDVIRGQQVPTLAISKHVSPVLGMIFALILILIIHFIT